MADWENIPRLDPALQDEIDGVQLKHTELVEAVRGYSGGSIAGKTNEVMGTHQDNLDTVATREKTLISAVGQPEPVPSMLLDFASQTYFTGIRGLEQAVDPHKYLNVSRSTRKWVMGPQGKLVEVPPNTLAYEYDPVTGEAKGVLIEESRTNLLTWSEDTSSWNKRDVAELEATSVPSPISGVNYLRLFALNDASSAGIDRGYAISDRVNGVHTGSFFVKSAGASIVQFTIGSKYDPYSRGKGVLHLESGEFSYYTSGAFTELNASATPLGNGEYRVSVTGAQNADASLRFYIYAYDERGDDIDSSIAAGSGLYVTGFQIEEGSTPSSYIPTTDSPVTRADDGVSRTLGDEDNPSEGTFTWDGYFSPLGGNSNYLLPIGISSPGYVNGFLMWHTRNAVRLSTFGDGDASSLNVDVSSYPLRVPTYFSVAFSYKRDEHVRLAVNGVFAGEASLAGLPALSRLYLYSSGGTEKERTVGSVRYIPRALTETELQELTANG